MCAAARETIVRAAADFGEQQFGVAEDAGERIVEFVAEDLAEVFESGFDDGVGTVGGRPGRRRAGAG